MDDDFQLVALRMTRRCGEEVVRLIGAKFEPVGNGQVRAEVQRVLHHIVRTVARNDAARERITIVLIEMTCFIFDFGDLKDERGMQSTDRRAEVTTHSVDIVLFQFACHVRLLFVVERTDEIHDVAETHFKN